MDNRELLVDTQAVLDIPVDRLDTLADQGDSRAGQDSLVAGDNQAVEDNQVAECSQAVVEDIQAPPVGQDRLHQELEVDIQLGVDTVQLADSLVEVDRLRPVEGLRLEVENHCPVVRLRDKGAEEK